MGKRKSAKKVASKKGPAPLDKTFRCLFCQHPGVVTCKLDKAARVGRLDCKVCSQSFQVSINHLTQPIDIYSEWIDAAEEVNQTEAARTEAGYTTQRPRNDRARQDDTLNDEDEMSDDDPDDEGSRRQTGRADLQPRDRMKQSSSRARAPVEDDDEELPEI